MKSINTLLSALFFLSAIVGITSCTEEADYTPAQKPENAQVYFATDEASTVSLNRSAIFYGEYLSYIPQGGINSKYH